MKCPFRCTGFPLGTLDTKGDQPFQWIYNLKSHHICLLVFHLVGFPNIKIGAHVSCTTEAENLSLPTSTQIPARVQ